MEKVDVEIGSLANLQVEMRTLGSDSYGESIIVLFKDLEQGRVLISFLIDSFSGVHDYLTQLKENENFNILSCIIWTHPHEDHTDDLLSILEDSNLVSLNKECPRIKKDTTRFIISKYFKSGKNNVFNFKYPNDDAIKIIEKGGSIGVMANEDYGHTEHYWNIHVKDTNKIFTIKITFITPHNKINNGWFGDVRGEKFNNFSLSFVVELIFDGNTIYSMFFGGDCNSKVFLDRMEEENDDKLKNLLKTCKTIKIPHHGSKNSLDIINFFDENLEHIICTSDTRTNLPHEAVIKKYSERGEVTCTKDIIEKGDRIGEHTLIFSFSENGEFEVTEENKSYK